MDQSSENKPNKKSLYVLIGLICLLIFTGIIYSQYRQPDKKSTANDGDETKVEDQPTEQNNVLNDANVADSQTKYLEGVSALDQKNYAEAIDYFDQAIAKNPNEPLSYSNKAEAQFNLGNKEGALETLRQGVAENPDSDLLKSKIDVLTKDNFPSSEVDAIRE